ncbi:MAG TPA: hypothetical protein VMO26_23285, partial [Vicinamibacterales bacterium]|nr:hypothetical protein [Vicinamibacterales bacterium]
IEDTASYSGRVGRITLAEHLDTDDPKDLPGSVGSYWLTMEAPISSRKEFDQSVSECFDIADDLDRCWIYATGEPFLAVRVVISFPQAPDGWSGNTRDLRKQLLHREGGLDAEGIETRSRPWMLAPRLPLRNAVEAIHQYRAASSATRTLIELHYQALKSTQGEARLFFLAKGLELVRALLAGRTLKDKEGGLPEAVHRELRRSLGWLYDMANNRIDIRHVILNPQGPELHRPLSDAERSDFRKDADLVLRGFICDTLDLELPIIELVDARTKD